MHLLKLSTHFFQIGSIPNPAHFKNFFTCLNFLNAIFFQIYWNKKKIQILQFDDDVSDLCPLRMENIKQELKKTSSR